MPTEQRPSKRAESFEALICAVMTAAGDEQDRKEGGEGTELPGLVSITLVLR